MSNDTQRYALGRLILDYVRTFLWPAVVLVVVLVYQDDVRKILQEREVDIFGLRIGEKVQEIETRALAEIGDIRTLLEEQQTRLPGSADPLITDIEVKLTSLERNLSREIATVQAPKARETRQVAGVEPDDRAARVAEAERRGFQALVDRDVRTALHAFNQAREIWPDYHNVAEISQMLHQWRNRLSDADSKDWPKLYREILTQYSWGLPKELRLPLREGAAKAYQISR